MGLSDQERVAGVLRDIPRWREAVVLLAEVVKRSNATAYKTVLNWVETIDMLSGMVLDKQMAGGLGRDERLSGMLMDDGFSDIEPPEYGSFYQTMDTYDYSLFTRVLSYRGHFKEDRVSHIMAAWWDQWERVSFIQYLINRYNDSVFSDEFKATFKALLGEMFNCRFEVYQPGGHTDYMSNKLRKLETAMLLKYQEVRIRMDALAVKGTELLHKAQPKKTPVSKMWINVLDSTIVDVGRLPIAEVSVAHAVRRREDYAEQIKHNAKYKEQENQKYSGVLGPSTVSKDALEKLVWVDGSYEEAKKAVMELRAHFGISCGNWENRFKKRKKGGK
jgi:hypothetical protein